MSKLQQILTYLVRKTRRRWVVSPRHTINYLTGFYSDPHERQMFLFVLADQTSPLCVPALEVERASSTFLPSSEGYRFWKSMAKNLKHAPTTFDFKCRCWVWQYHLVTKYHFENSDIETWVWQPLSSYTTHAPHHISWWRVKNDGVAWLCWDKAVHVFWHNISLDKTETDIIAQIVCHVTWRYYEKSFDTMVLTG